MTNVIRTRIDLFLGTTGSPLPRESKQIQVGTYPFDLQSMKKSPMRETGYFSRLIDTISSDKEEEFILPSVEDYLGVYHEDKSVSWTFSPSIPNPHDTLVKWNELIQLRQEANFFHVPDKERFIKKVGRLFLLKGRLMRSADGLFYLQLPPSLVTIITDFITQIDASVPPFFHLSSGVGPHIPVILPFENLDGYTHFPDVGQEFYFVIKDILSQDVAGWEGVEKVFYLSIKSYDLEVLRRKHCLLSSIQGDDFMCIVGVKKGETKIAPSFFKVHRLSSPA